MKNVPSKTAVPRKTEDTKTSPAVGIKADRSGKRPMRFINNPFYDALVKKK
jgi:hypothetical protein